MHIAAPADGQPAPRPEAPAWEDPPRRDSATDAPVLRANGFEWPLDWLLEMARNERIVSSLRSRIGFSTRRA